jgi:putative ABC transport system substrate-binding protein
MKRREFIAIASSAAVSWTHTTYAQRSKVPTLGVLVPGTPDPGAFWRVLREGLRDFGYVDGQTVRFEFRSAEGKADMLSQLAAELTSMKVDLIITYQTPAAIAAKQATREIPIVMAPAGDPVGTGLVASLAQPGGNVTGLSGTNAELGGKNLELLREILPSMHRVAVLANAVDPFSRPFVEQLQIAARSISVDLRIFMITRPDELDASLTQASRDGADAIIVQPSLSRRRAAELALKLRLPTISPTRSFTEEGGLLSYSASNEDLFRKAAWYVDRILKGSKPADLPIQQPTKFELAVNLKTAKGLGLMIPQSVVVRADEVIE